MQESAESVVALRSLTEQERATYAAQVKPARRKAAMSQQELADAAQVSRGTVSNIERGATIPQEDGLRAVMTVLGLRVDGEQQWPEWVEEWVAVIGPLMARLSPERRGDVLGRVVVMLGEAMRDGR